MSQKIHRISAREDTSDLDPTKDTGSAKKVEKVKSVEEAVVVKSEEKVEKTLKKSEKKSDKTKKSKKKMPTWLAVVTWPFRMIAKPFIALGRYIHDSWLELRQVRWPSRGATWKMFFAIIVYAGLFMGLIALLDMLFTWLFNLIIG